MRRQDITVSSATVSIPLPVDTQAAVFNIGIGCAITAGTYYGRLGTLTGGILPVDAAQLTYSLIWEERVP